MKKIITIGVIVFALIVLTSVLFYAQLSKKALTFEAALPSDAIFYAHVINPEQTLDDFLNTQLVAELKAVQFEKVLTSLNASQEELALYDQLAKQIFSAKNREFFSKLFGREFAVAFYPSDLEEENEARNILGSLSRIILMTRLKPEVRFVEVLTAAASKISSEINETTREYMGETIRILDVQGSLLQIGYIRFGDILVLGIGDSAAKRAIEVIKGEAAPLVEDHIFVKTRQDFLSNPRLQGYLQYDLLMKQMKEGVLAIAAKSGQNDPKILAQIEQGFKEAMGFKLFMFSNQIEDVFRGRFDITFDEDQLSKEMTMLHQFNPKENKSLSFAPRSPVIYYWNSFIEVEAYWKKIKTEMAAAAAESDQADSAPDPFVVLGLNVDELVSVLNNDFGGYLSGVEVSEMLPLPQGVFFIGVKDQQRAAAILKQMIEVQGFIRTEKEEYNGVSIDYVKAIPFVSQLQPSYCFFRDHLLLATNRDLLKQALDAQENQASLQSNVIFDSGDEGFKQAGNGTIFIEVSRLMPIVSSVLEWANKWADIQQARKEAFKQGAQKRLEEVLQDIEEKKNNLDQLEKRLVEDQQIKESLVVAPEVVQEVNEEIERKKKLQVNFKKSVDALQEEKQQLMQAQQDETQQLTPEGEKRLEEVEKDLVKREAKYQELTAEINALLLRQQEIKENRDKQEELVASISQGEEKFAEMRRDLILLEEKQGEVEEMIKGYDQDNMPTSKQRQQVLTGLINPVIQSFAEIQWVGVWTEMMDDRIRSEFLMEVK